MKKCATRQTKKRDKQTKQQVRSVSAPRAEPSQDKPQWTCWHCLFYVSDLLLLSRTFLSAFPIMGLCANHADAPGRVRPARYTGVCRNFRMRPFRTDPPAPPNDRIRYIPLTRGLHAIVDAEDYEWLSQYKWQAAPATTSTTCYAKRCQHGRLILMHREIMNPPKGKFVDHINGNGLDNRRCNLRICDAQENCCNRSKLRGAAYKYIGVYRSGKNTYKAGVMRKGKTYRAGPFRDEIEAAKARDRLALKHHGPYAHLNFPPEETEAE